VAQPNAEPGEIIPTTQATQKPAIVEDESCLPWELPNANATSVSAVRLGVTNKARSQYEKACSAFKKKKLTEAEQHARDAIQQYPKYPAAWVMLGKVLGDQQKMDEAHDACSQPLKADPTYLPPYLCLAGLLDVEKRWDDLLAWSDRFRGMNQTGDIYSDYYRALSFFHLHKLPDAQKSASEAIAKDSLHHQPGLYFLLAQIYGQQGDVANAAAQVQQFVKYAGNKQDKDAAKEYLSELQTRQSAKESQP
jgi:tetratricopeptide (TPR) repeat protein